MDVQRAFGFLPLLPLLLLGGCSPDEPPKQASLQERTSQFEKTLESIQDPTLKDAVADLGGSLLLLERAHTKLQGMPLDTRYGEDALALLRHYPDPQAMAHAYIDGLFVLRKRSSSDYLTDLQPVFPFALDQPDELALPQKLDWLSVTLSNKQTVSFAPEWSETDPGIQLSPTSSNLTNPNDLTITYPFIEGIEVENRQQPQPKILHGKIEVIVPARVVTFTLSHSDIGQIRSQGNIQVRLLGLEQNQARLELIDAPKLAPELADSRLTPMLVQARDTSGQWLSRAGSINESPEQLAFYRQQLGEMLEQKSWSLDLEKRLNDEQRAFDQPPHYYTQVYFNGQIDQLEVSVLDFSTVSVVRKDLDLPVRQFDPTTTDKDIQPLDLPVTVYDEQAGQYLCDADLEPEQLRKNVRIIQSVQDASAARIEFEHLRTFNDELIGSSIEPGDAPLTFFTANAQGQRGAPIELPSQAFDIEPLHGRITYDLNLFPDTPAYAVGSMPMFLAAIEKAAIAGNALPKGLALKGNALIVDQRLFPADSWRFYAKDGSGHYLKEILAVSHLASQGGPAVFNVHYFYGQPDNLESYQRTELQTVEYGFEIKLDKPEPHATAQ